MTIDGLHPPQPPSALASQDKDADEARLHPRGRRAALAAAAVLLAVPVVEGWFDRARLDAHVGSAAEMMWLFHVIAIALLAAQWRMRGALAGLAVSLSLLAIVEFAVLGASPQGSHALAGVVFVVLADIALSLTIGWLAERVYRADDVRRLTAESARQLAAAEARYRALVEQLPVVAYTAALDIDGSTLYIGPQVEGLLGYRPEEFVARRSLWANMLHPDDRERVLAPVDWAMHNDRCDIEYRVRHRDGHVIWLRDEYRVIRDADGRPVFMQGVIQDVSARKAADEALRLRERAMAAASDGIIITDAAQPDNPIVYVNPAFERITGYSAAEVVGRNAHFLHGPETEVDAIRQLRDAIRERREVVVTLRTYRKDGAPFWNELRLSPVLDTRGAVTQFIGVMRDVTDRRESLERLRTAELLYRTVIEQSPAATGISLRDARSTVVYVSPQIETMLGYAVEEWLADPDLWLRHIHPDDRERIVAEHERTNDVGEPFVVEYRMVAKDERVVWIWNHATLLPTEDDQNGRWQWLMFDVTARKQAQNAAQEHEARFRAAVEGSFDAFYILQTVRDDAGRILDFTYIDLNERAAALLGLQTWELIGRRYSATLPPARFAHYMPRFIQAVESGQAFEEETVSAYPNGAEMVLHYQAVPFGDGLAVTTRDITERKRAEAARLEAEARYRMLVEHVPAVTYIQAADALASTIFISPQIEGLLGYTPDEWLADAGLWLALMHPDDLERVRAEHLRTNRTGEPFRMEYRFVTRDGQIVWVRDEGVLMQDAGQPPFWQGVFLDITERKRADLALAGQNQVLEALSTGQSLSEVLATLCRALEAQLQGGLCSVLLLDDSGQRLTHGVGPSLPADYLRAIDGAEIGPDVGTCGNAAARGETTISPDIANDPRWGPFKELALGHGLRSCWSEPIRDSEQRVLGTFAVYHREPRQPRDGELALIAEASKLAQVVIQRARAEADLREAEQKFRTLIEQMPAITYTAALDEFSTTLFIGPQVEMLLGYTPDEITHNPHFWIENLHPDDRDAALDQLARANAAGEGLTLEYRMFARDGRVVWLRDELEPIFDIEGQPLYAQGVWVDITAQKQAEEQRRAAEERFRTLVEQMPAVVYTNNVGVPHVTLYMSPRVEELLGYPTEQWLADPELWFSILHPDDEEYVRAEWERSGVTREPFQCEYRATARDGRVIWLRDEARVVYDAAGQPLFWQGVWLDITGRRQAEEQLRQQTAYVRLLQSVAVAANEATSVEAAMRMTLDQVCGHIGWPIGHVLLPAADDPAQGFVSSGIWHLDDPERFGPFRQISALMRFQPGLGLPGQVLASGRPLWLDDVRERSGARSAELAEQIGIHSGIACPVLVGSEVVAVLEFFTDVVQRTDDALLDVLGQIGTQLGRVVERKQAVEALRGNEERFRSLVQDGADVILILDEQATFQYVSPSIETVFGYAPHALLGTSALTLIHQGDLETASVALRAALTGSEAARTQVRVRHMDGAWRHVEAIAKNQFGNPSVRGLVVTARDITERKQFEEQLEHQAFYDPLTGLPNRALFLNRLDHALALAVRGDGTVGVMFLDLDRFKIINDSLGHAVGDQLLQLLGGRILDCLRAGDTVARLGGDEFIILLEGIREEAEAVVIAERVLDAFRAPFILGGHEVSLSTSIGIVVTQVEDERASEAGELLRMADIALYRAKATGRASYAIFDPSMNVFSVERLKLESDLQRAVERDELRLHYQPELDLASGAVTGVEALARWQHPEHGLIAPGEFIPIAEETDLIVSLGQWVLEEACRQARVWHDACPRGSWLAVSVNLSARQFQQPDIVARVAGALRTAGVDPALVRLEITESVVVQDAESTIETLRALKALGVKLAIDDFGTGYSSLSYLTRLVVDTLKVDRSFVSGVNSDARSASIVGAIVTLAHSLDMRVTAEGLETDEQVARMQAVGCDHGQGFHYARPLPPDELTAWLGARPAPSTQEGHGAYSVGDPATLADVDHGQASHGIE